MAKTVFCVLMLFLFTGCLQETPTPVACTLDAKICPDGSAVGRIGPDCEFAACPGDALTSATDTPPPKHFPDTPKPNAKCVDGQTKEATCPDGVTTYLAENCVDGKWATVMYIRNPCEPLPTREPEDLASSGKICPSVCVPMWQLKGGQCDFTDCGSGCGADGKTTFRSEAECNIAAVGITLGETCDADRSCAAGLDCYKFEGEKTAICWSGDPCEKCVSKKCDVAESYPMQVFCK